MEYLATYRGDCFTNYDIIKDPYQTTRIPWKVKVFPLLSWFGVVCPDMFDVVFFQAPMTVREAKQKGNMFPQLWFMCILK